MFDTGEQLELSYAVASQLVSHDHPRHILQTLQQAPEETLCGFGVAPLLNKDVEHNAILIHGSPKIVLDALDPDEDRVEVPLVSGRGRRWRRRSTKLWPNFLHQRRTVS
jgi:hypothetical protein